VAREKIVFDMIIGITGTDGAGKGETVQWTVARPCQPVCTLATQTSDKVYSACKELVPNEIWKNNSFRAV
jgi:hypothetical protein